MWTQMKISGHWYWCSALNFNTNLVSMVVWPGEAFWKNCFPKMVSSSSIHQQPLAMGSLRGGAPRQCRGGLGPPVSYTFTNTSTFTSYFRMVGPSVFPDSQVISERLVLQYLQIRLFHQNFQIHRSCQNGWSFIICRFTDYIRMVGSPAFPDSRVEKFSVGTQTWLFGTDFKSEMTSKCILDDSWALPDHFPHITAYHRG